MRKKFKRFLFLLSWLKAKTLSFEEIESKLALYNDEEHYSLRQFQRDIKELEDIFGGEVKNIKGLGYRFESTDDNKIQLFESLDYINSIFLNPGGGDMILLEKRRSSGSEHISAILKAIEKKNVLKIDYHPFYAESSFSMTLEPLAIKQAVGRLYLLAYDATKDNKTLFKSFGLDRIKSLEITTKKFKLVTKIDFEKYFEFSFGIYDNSNVVDVLLEVEISQGHYLNTYPLHATQKLETQTKDKMTFSMKLSPTSDFIMELLSHGSRLKVMKPAWLVQEIKKELKNNLKNY